MKNNEKASVFKKGIWIKEQHGSLTIGSLDKNDTRVNIVPESFRNTLEQFETDMIEALYGEDVIPYNPKVFDVENLLKNLERQYQEHDLKISFSSGKGNGFKGDYNKIYAVLDKLVQSSITGAAKKSIDNPILYINASMPDEHLCVIYRDSGSFCQPSRLNKVMQYIQNELKGEITYKTSESDKSYFDIMIPPKGE